MLIFKFAEFLNLNQPVIGHLTNDFRLARNYLKVQKIIDTAPLGREAGHFSATKQYVVNGARVKIFMQLYQDNRHTTLLTKIFRNFLLTSASHSRTLHARAKGLYCGLGTKFPVHGGGFASEAAREIYPRRTTLHRRGNYNRWVLGRVAEMWGKEEYLYHYQMAFLTTSLKSYPCFDIQDIEGRKELVMNNGILPPYCKGGIMKYLVIKALKKHYSYRDDSDYYYIWNVIDTTNYDSPVIRKI